MSLLTGGKFVGKVSVQPALSLSLTLPMPLKGAVILTACYMFFDVKQKIKEGFCLYCQGMRILLSLVEVYKDI